MFDDDITLGGKKNNFSELPRYCHGDNGHPLVWCIVSTTADDDEDISDDFIPSLMIVTQPPYQRKHDITNTGYLSKAKLSADISQAISDGLYFYEQVL